MGVAPPGPFQRRVRAAPPHRAPRGANACVHVTARESFAAWLAAFHNFRRASGFVFRLDRLRGVDFLAVRSDVFVLQGCFSLNRSFSGRDSVLPCETAARMHAVRSNGFLPRLDFDQQTGMPLPCQIEGALGFPQLCEYPAALYLLFLLLMNYLSRPQSSYLHGLYCNSLRGSADPAPQLCVRSPQICGLAVLPLGFTRRG